MNIRKLLATGALRCGLIVATLFALAACGGGSSGGGGGTPPATYAISGTVTGATSVAVALSGAASAATTTDANGNYSFSGLANGSYTVTPSLSGFTFAPASAAVTVSGANVAATNFTATMSTATYTITGMVTTSTGAASSGVTLTLSGAASASQVSDASGAYTFSGLAAGAYTVTPSLAGYTFAPVSAAVTITAANATATTLVATAVVVATYSVSGTVSGAVAAGVAIDVSGHATATATTAANGTYSVTGLANGSYVVTPVLSGYTFSPVSTNVTVNGANVAATNFTSTANIAQTYSLTGTVSGAWVDRVTVTLSGAGTGSTTTDATGKYSFTNLPAGSYTVTPALAGYTYTPAAPAVAVNANATQNFTAASAYTAYGVSGALSYAGTKTGPVHLWVYQSCSSCGNQSPVAGTTVALTGSAGAYTGSYAIRGLQPGNYVVAAEIDTLATGQSNASNPAGQSAALSISGANISGANIALGDPGTVTPAAVGSFSVAPESASALIQYSPNQNATNQEVGTSYKVYWGTDTAASNGGSKTFAAQGNNINVYVLKGLANGATYFKMTTLVGATESAATPVVGPVTVGTTSGANTVSGTVTFPGTASGPLIVGVHSKSAVYYAIIANPVSPQAYSVAGVASGSYQLFALVDMNNNGVVDAGDLSNIGGQLASTTISGNLVANVILSNVPENASIYTDHLSDGTSNSYSFNLGTSDGVKRAVAVTVFSGPNFAVPFDLGATSGNEVYVPLGNGATRPTTGDTYDLRVVFSDGTTQDITAAVTGVLDAFPTSLQVNSGAPYSRNVPQFLWAAPASPPSSYTYRLNLSGNDANWYFPNNNGLPSTTLNAVYNSDGNASKSTLTTGVPYNWQVSVRDENTFNSATYQAPAYTP